MFSSIFYLNRYETMRQYQVISSHECVFSSSQPFQSLNSFLHLLTSVLINIVILNSQPWAKDQNPKPCFLLHSSSNIMFILYLLLQQIAINLLPNPDFYNDIVWFSLIAWDDGQ